MTYKKSNIGNTKIAPLLFGNVIIKQSPRKRILQSLKEQLIKPNVSPFAYLNFHFLGASPGQSRQGEPQKQNRKKRPFISFRTSYRRGSKAIDFSVPRVATSPNVSVYFRWEKSSCKNDFCFWRACWVEEWSLLYYSLNYLVEEWSLLMCV